MLGIKQSLYNENITNNKINNKKTFHKQHIKYIQQKLTEQWEREKLHCHTVRF